jgi:excisionase family DNA binding protein
MLTPEQKRQAITATASGLPLSKVAVGLGITPYLIQAIRLSDPPFDAALVAASAGRLRPLILTCPPDRNGPHCGTVYGAKLRCHNQPCRRALKAMHAQMPLQQFRRADMLTTGQAAKLLGVNVKTVIRLAETGQLPCTRTTGGHRRFRRQDLQAHAPHLKPRLDTAALIETARAADTALAALSQALHHIQQTITDTRATLARALPQQSR